VRILVADDDPVFRSLLQGVLEKWGHHVTLCRDGVEAWEALQEPGSFEMAVLDWMMPGLNGLDLCRNLRRAEGSKALYVILATSRGQPEDVVRGLDEGADDYLVKPLDLEELRARVGVGQRILDLQAALAERVRELEGALARVKQLHGLLPICSYCKKIRNDEDYWEQLEAYLGKHTDAQFSHGICPACYERVVKPQLEVLRDRKT
jgi:CheY-like chemotaxis protein